jgi:NodT family efflux transporter outer membrane factor (OMF) lipoprotein
MFPSRFACTALGLAAALALAGCATTVPSTPPLAGVAVPGAWSAAAPAEAAAVGTPWWQGFGDAELTGLVERALAANTDVTAAQAALRRARALREVAAAGRLPSLGVSAAAQRSRPAAGAATTLFDAGFDAAWEPDLFGAVGRAVDAATAEARAAALSLEATRVSLAAEVVADLVQWRATQARLRLARDNLAAQEETLQIARWRQQAGLASSLEVEQAATAAAQTRAQLPALNGTALQTRHALAVLTGAVPTALDATLDAAAALPVPVPVATDTPLQVLRRRPDVAAAEAQLDAAAQRVAQADAARRPTVALRASLGWSALTLGALGSTGAAASLLASVSQPLFDGGQRRAQLDAQQAAYDAARESYRARVLGALQDVEDALVALEAARRRLAALREAEQSASTAAWLAEQRYAAGVVDFLTVLETQRNRLSLQDGRASAEADAVTAHVRLVKALGGGVPAVAEAKPSDP